MPGVHRTALVGVGPRGSEELCLVVEPEPGADRERIVQAIRARASEVPDGELIRDVLFHESFPVDVRHNAKIHRGELKFWAEERLR